MQHLVRLLLCAATIAILFLPGAASPAMAVTPPLSPPDAEAAVSAYITSGGTGSELSTEASIANPPDNRCQVTLGPLPCPGPGGNVLAPYRWVVQLQVTFPGRAGTCTGFLIGPKTVITAGHCLYSPSIGRWARSVRVAPGKDGGAEPFGSQNSVILWSVCGWVGGPGCAGPAGDPCYDYGAVILNKPFAGMVGPFFPFADIAAVGQTPRLSGYPGDKGGLTQWFDDDLVNDTGNAGCAAPKLVSFQIDGCPGQSGSPVWYPADAEVPIVEAIFTYQNGQPAADVCNSPAPFPAGLPPCVAQPTTNAVNNNNCGRRIDAAAAANLNYWLACAAGPADPWDPDSNCDVDFRDPGPAQPCVQDHAEDPNGDGYSDSDEFTPLGGFACTAGPVGRGLAHANVDVACPGRLYLANGGNAAQDLGARRAHADVDLSGKVALGDLIVMAGQFNKAVTGPTDMRADLDLSGNAKVDLADLIIGAGLYNQVVPAC